MSPWLILGLEPMLVPNLWNYCGGASHISNLEKKQKRLAALKTQLWQSDERKKGHDRKEAWAGLALYSALYK